MSIDKNTRIIDLTVGEFEEVVASATIKQLAKLENQLTQISKKEEKPMNLKQACGFLQITVPTFNKYRHLVTDYGLPGTPRFLASELLKIKESLKRNKAA